MPAFPIKRVGAGDVSRPNRQSYVVLHRVLNASPRFRAGVWLPSAKVATLAAVFILGSQLALAQPALAQGNDKPYDDKIMRVSEILGAVHYLRELCGANEGQTWRDKMNQLLESEGFTALRRARLTRRFNQGYQNYSRTYKECTPTAKTAISKFLAEGAQLAETMIRSIP